MTPAAEQEGDALAVWLLAVGQTLAYGCLFYAFPALIVAIEADTGWSKPALALGPTLALAIAALVSPFSGRLVDRGWGGEALTGAALLGAGSLVMIGLAEGQAAWLLAWALSGLAQGAAFYDTCFAFLVRRLGRGARAAIIRVTLVAGFASTLTYPAGAWLGQAVGWRASFWIFAALLASLGAGVNAWGAARLRRRARAGRRAYADPPGMLAQAMARAEFWLLSAIFALVYLAHGMIITFAIPLFQDRGGGHALAVTAASLIGPAQVAGRLLFLAGGARLGLVAAGRAVLAGMAGGVLFLALSGAAPGLIFAFALTQGAGIGIVSVLRPVLAADVLGQDGFGAISGALAVSVLAGAAAAPWLGALVLDGGGTGALIGAVGAMTLASLGLAMLLRRG